MSKLRGREGKCYYFGHLREQSVNCLAQTADSFAVNDANTKDTPLAALEKILGHQIFHFFGIKAVQIKHSVNRILDRFRRLWILVFHLQEV